MSRFPNGQIPSNLLVELAPYHWMPAATAVRWKSLVEDIRRNEGVTMYITPGKNAYRDYEGQVFARNNACAEGRCNDAAVPGTSSHGGEYQGRDSMAIDVNNWAEIGQDKWYAYCRKHGFEPGFFDWEPWHIIDWSPWAMPAGGKDPAPATPEEEEDEDMAKMKGAYWTRAADKVVEYMLFNEESGFHVEHTKVPGSYNNTIAGNWETNSWSPITEGHSRVLKAALDRVLVKQITGKVSVDIDALDLATLPKFE